MSAEQPNIVFFFWDNFGWGELGCYGGGVLRGAPTPRIDKLAGEGMKLLNFNVEAQCTPSRSALLTGRHPIRSGTQTVAAHRRCRRHDPLGGDDRPGAVGCRVRDRDVGQVAPGQRPGAAQPGRLRVRRGGVVARGPPTRCCGRCSPTSPTARSTAAPYAGSSQIPMEPEPIYARKKGAQARGRSRPTTRSSGPGSTARSPTGRSTSCPARTRRASRSTCTCLTPRCTSRPIPDPEYAGRTKRGNWADILTQMDDFTGQILDTLGPARDSGRHDRGVGVRQRPRPGLPRAGR